MTESCPRCDLVYAVVPGPATEKMLDLLERELNDYLDGLAPEARDEEDVKIVRAFLEEWGRPEEC